MRALMSLLACCLLSAPAWAQPAARAAGHGEDPAASDSAIDVRALGAKCDGADTSSDTPAFVRAAAAAQARPFGSVIRVPAGRCMLSAPIAATLRGNQSLAIRGEGSDVSELVFTGGTDGIALRLGGSGADGRGETFFQRSGPDTGTVARVEGLSLVRDAPDTGGIALDLDGLTNGNNGVVQAVVRDVTMRGSAGRGGWDKGVRLHRICMANLRDLTFHAGDKDNHHGVGLSLENEATPVVVDTSISGFRMRGGATAIKIGPRVQGVYVSQLISVDAVTGIEWLGRVGGHEDLLTVTNSHVGGFTEAAIRTKNVKTILVSDSYLLAAQKVDGETYAPLDLYGASSVAITGNRIFAAPGISNQSAVKINNHPAPAAGADPGHGGNPDNSPAGTISGNALFLFNGYAFKLTGPVAGLVVSGNTCAGCNNLTNDRSGLNAWAENLGWTRDNEAQTTFTDGSGMRHLRAGRLNVSGLPTSPAGLKKGDVWLNGSALAVAP